MTSERQLFVRGTNIRKLYGQQTSSQIPQSYQTHQPTHLDTSAFFYTPPPHQKLDFPDSHQIFAFVAMSSNRLSEKELQRVKELMTSDIEKVFKDPHATREQLRTAYDSMGATIDEVSNVIKAYHQDREDKTPRPGKDNDVYIVSDVFHFRGLLTRYSWSEVVPQSSNTTKLQSWSWKSTRRVRVLSLCTCIGTPAA